MDQVKVKKPFSFLLLAVISSAGMLLVVLGLFFLDKFSSRPEAPEPAAHTAERVAAPSAQLNRSPDDQQSTVGSTPLPKAADSPVPAASKTESDGCYGTMIPTMNKSSSETRRQYAMNAGEVADKILGPDLINVSAKGKDNEYLLFVSTPEQRLALSQVAEAELSDPSDRAKFCVEGFAEVQFIIRDHDMNQTLVANYKTNPGETLQYVMQRGGATPIK